MNNRPSDNMVLAISILASVSVVAVVFMTIFAPTNTDTVVIIGLIFGAVTSVIMGILNHNKTKELEIKVDGTLDRYMTSVERAAVEAERQAARTVGIIASLPAAPPSVVAAVTPKVETPEE